MVVLARIDQRLIHGLVVNQWAPALQVKRFMVVDDVLCNNDDIKASMRMAKPAGTGVSVISTETAITKKVNNLFMKLFPYIHFYLWQYFHIPCSA